MKQRRLSHRRPRVGVALGGGGALGMAHVGVLAALMKNDIPIDCIAGTSAGALVATGYAFGMTTEEMKAVAIKLNWPYISSFPNSLLGFASNRSIEVEVERYLGNKGIEQANIPLAIVVTDIEDGERVILRSGRAALAVRASTCIPGMFVPVEIDGRKFVDGGLTENLPLSPLREMDAEIKIGVNVVHWHSRREVKNVIDVMTNTISILASHQRHLVPQNVDILIEPNLSAYTPSDFKKNMEIIEEGYRAAMAKVPEIQAMMKHRSRKGVHVEKAQGILGRIWNWFRE
jgi:NTE family protein